MAPIRLGGQFNIIESKEKASYLIGMSDLIRNEIPENHHEGHHCDQPSRRNLSIWTLLESTPIAHNGCKHHIPTLEAITPVKKGKKALPACPNPAIQPIDSVNIHRGRIREA